MRACGAPVRSHRGKWPCPYSASATAVQSWVGAAHTALPLPATTSTSSLQLEISASPPTAPAAPAAAATITTNKISLAAAALYTTPTLAPAIVPRAHRVLYYYTEAPLPRPWNDLLYRAHPGRRGDGPLLVRGAGQVPEQAQHLHGLHFLRRAPARGRLVLPARPPRLTRPPRSPRCR